MPTPDQTAVAALPDPPRPILVSHADPAHASVVLVDWMLGNSCNYACSYCPSGLHDGSIRWQDSRDIVRLFDALKLHYIDTLGRRVWLQFTGGEPTMHPGIVGLLDAAAERGLATSLISNAGRTLRFWERIVHRLDSVILTYHDEFVDHARFLHIAALLAEVMPVHINVTVHPDRFDAILERAAQIGDVAPSASIALKPLRVGFGSTLFDYSAEQLQRLEGRITRPDRRDVTTPRGVMVERDDAGAETPMRANEFILRNRNHWQGYLCEAGLESLRVFADGRLFRAVCGVGGEVGRLGQPFELPVSPIACSKATCSCVADVLITKRRMSLPE